MPSSKTYESQVSTIIETLAQSAHWLKNHDQAAAQPHLPSREEIHDVIELLRSLLFPGYFGLSDVTGDFLSYRLGSLLEETTRKLRTQILSSLRFAGTTEIGANPETRADHIVEEFIARLPGIKALLSEDVREAYNGDPACASEDEAIFCYPGIQAMTNHRIAHELAALEVPLLPRIISEQAHSITGIDIHPKAEIGPGLFIDHGTGVVIGETCRIGRRVKIYQGVTLGAKSFPLDERGNPIKGIPRHPQIEDGVIIYSGATILGHITIGHDSVIGGNVWLTHSVAPHSRVFQRAPREDSHEDGSGI